MVGTGNLRMKRSIAVVGSRSSNKSSLITQFVEDQFVESYYPTIERTFEKSVAFNGTEYDCQIIDTAGQDEYSILSAKHAIGIHGYILVYSVTSRDSFHLIQIVYDKIIDFCGVTEFPCVIVGTKPNLSGNRQVETSEGERLAAQNKAAFMESIVQGSTDAVEVFKRCLGEIQRAAVGVDHRQPITWLHLPSPLLALKSLGQYVQPWSPHAILGRIVLKSAITSTTDSSLTRTGTSLIRLVHRIEHIFVHPQLCDQLFSDVSNSQLLVNMFKAVLDRAVLSTTTRKLLSKAFFRISRKYDVYPDYASLDALTLRGTYPLKMGGFGEVWIGDVQGYAVSVKAAKIYQHSDTVVLKKAFTKEATVWSQFSHQNVLPFYGMYLIKYRGLQNVCLISPWMENGSVMDYLKSHPQVNRTMLIVDSATGLQYLHENDVVHGDLKGANILVTSSGRACICDFGLAKLVIESEVLPWVQSQSTSDGGAGSVRWQAAEILHGAPSSKLTDIYAFACVCYEIYAGFAPFFDVAKHDGAVINKVVNGHRPDLSRLEIHPQMRKLVALCWAQDPEQRPIASYVTKTIQEILGILPNDFADLRWDPELRTERRVMMHGHLDANSVKIYERLLASYSTDPSC